MNRRRRTEVLIEGNPVLRAELARVICAAVNVVDLGESAEGLVMIKMREEARASLFYMGEVLVSEAKVRIGSTIGLGIVRGHAAEAARELAVIDAAYKEGLSLLADWEDRLLQEEAVIAARRAHEGSAVAGTRVVFESLDQV